MQYRTHRDLRISAIGYGCYAAGGAYGAVSRDDVRKVIDRARARGVTFFDTAEAYGDAEALLGDALKPYRSEVTIATKVGVRGDGTSSLKADAIAAACDRSLRALQTEVIDLYQVHFDDPETPVAETVAALESLRRSGKIRHFGVGHLPPERVGEYLAAGDPFSILMELSPVQLHARSTLLPLCQEHDVGAIAFSITGRGALSGRLGRDVRFAEDDIRRIDPLFQRERFDSALRVMRHLKDLGIPMGLSPAQVAIAWVLAQPGVVCGLTGPTSLEHLEENLSAASATLPAQVVADIEQFLTADDARMRREQRASIARILNGPLPEDPGAAFTDLVYVMETAITAGTATEARILPWFHQLLALRKRLAESRPAMVEIQTGLRALLEQQR